MPPLSEVVLAENAKRPTGPLCYGCHSVNYNVQTKTVAEWNVGCERCHGPGSEHVRRPSPSTIVNPARLVDGKLPPKHGLSVIGNGTATFANLHWDQLDVKKPLASLGRITRDLAPHATPLDPLPPVRLEGVP